MDHYCKNCAIMIYPDIRQKEANRKGYCSSTCLHLAESKQAILVENLLKQGPREVK